MSGHIFNASIIARVYQDQHNQGDFDPRNQSFVLLAKDGSMHLNRLSFVKDFQHQFFLDGCILASEIGATAVMLILYVLLTTGIKRRSTMFVMNSLAMFLNILRLSTFMHYYDDPWQDPYAMLTQDIHTYVRPREIAYSTASGIFNVLMLITLYGAMFVQIWVACHKIRVLYRNIVYAVSTTLVLFGMGLTLLNQVSVIENNIHHRDTRSAWNIPAEFIVRALMIFWTALVFTTRMGRNMWRMRRVGNKTFGVIQIFLIMGVYGLTTPTALMVTQEIYDGQLTYMNGTITSVVILCLPFTSIWAAAVQKNVARPITRSILPRYSGERSSLDNTNLTAPASITTTLTAIAAFPATPPSAHTVSTTCYSRRPIPDGSDFELEPLNSMNGQQNCDEIRVDSTVGVSSQSASCTIGSVVERTSK